MIANESILLYLGNKIIEGKKTNFIFFLSLLVT